MPKVIENIRGDILDTAESIIKEEGLDKFNIRYIAGKCGIGMGTIYNYYESKECIIGEILHRKMSEILNIIREETYREITQRKKAEKIFSILREYFINMDKELLNAFVPIIWESVKNMKPEDIAATIEEHIKDAQNEMKDIIKTCLKIEKEFDAEAIVTIFMIYSKDKNIKFDDVWGFISKAAEIGDEQIVC